MRVLAIMAVVCGHTFAFLQRDVANFSFVQVVSKRFITKGILGNFAISDNGAGVTFLSVDTFFFFSGFLAFYGMLSTVGNFPKKDAAWWAEGGVTKNAAKYTFSAVLHRYTRLTPMYFFILMVYIYIFPILGNGPTWNETNGDNTFCKDFWWTNILYISNLYPCQLWNHHSSNPKNDWGNDQCASGDGELGCYIQTWYLSNDFQMFIAAIPAALLFKWKIHAAYAYTAGLILVSLAYTAHLLDHFNGTMCDMIICGGGGHRRLQDDGGPAFCGTFPDAGPDASSPDFQVLYYDKAWCRFPPYGVGMLLALLFMHLRRDPHADPNEAVTCQSNGTLLTTPHPPSRLTGCGCRPPGPVPPAGGVKSP
jgi:hypothetical protein